MFADSRVFTCSFTRQNSIPDIAGKFFPLDENYYILFAQGFIDSTGKFEYHKVRLSSSNMYNLLDTSGQPVIENTNKTQGVFVWDSFTLQWTDLPKQTQFEYSVETGQSSRAVNNYYAAIGFTDKQQMANADVVCCKISNNVGQVERLYNEGKSQPLQLSPPTVGISEARVTVENGVLKCSFKREKFVSGAEKYFDLSARSYILIVGSSHSRLYIFI
jgi:hypothetical protein